MASGIERDMLLRLATDAARAGAAALRGGAGKQVREYAVHDTKLHADVLAEECIVSMLRKRSSFPILSEEAGIVQGAGEYRWIVDPLDGTVNYSRGIPLVVVSIALWRADEPVLGVVYDIAHDTMFTGIVGAGAWKNGELMQVSATADVSQGILATGFPRSADFSSGAIRQFVGAVQSFHKIRMFGTAALSLAYVAAGHVDAYREDRVMLWDVAAGLALVSAAGGVIKHDPTEKEYCVKVAASNGKIVLP